MRLGELEMEKTLDKIVALSKSRGFVYPASEFTVDWPTRGIMETSVLS